MQYIDTKTVKEQLQKDGVIFFRKLAKSLSDFETLTQQWFDRFHKPASRAPGNPDRDYSYTSQPSGKGFLLAHAEGYYRPCLAPPDVCLFWCQEAPIVSGGETTWVDAADLLNELPSSVRDRFSKEPIVYESTWTRERWQAEFGVTNVVGLKNLLDVDPSCRYHLDENEQLLLLYEDLAVKTGADGIPRFINGVLAHLPLINHPRYKSNVYCKPSNRIHWSKGGEIETEIVNLVIDAHDRTIRKHRWQNGDLLILDNHRFLHGRVQMSQPCQRVIFSRFAYL